MVTTGIVDDIADEIVTCGRVLNLGMEVVYGQALDTTFRMPIYPMLNQRNANPMTPNTGL